MTCGSGRESGAPNPRGLRTSKPDTAGAGLPIGCERTATADESEDPANGMRYRRLEGGGVKGQDGVALHAGEVKSMPAGFNTTIIDGRGAARQARHTSRFGGTD